MPDKTQAEELDELARLLDEATAHAFERGGVGKSAEGRIALNLGDYEDRQLEPLKIRSVHVYSYMLGPSRDHEFDTVTDALAEVRLWHKNEMERTDA